MRFLFTSVPQSLLPIGGKKRGSADACVREQDKVMSDFHMNYCAVFIFVSKSLY